METVHPWRTDAEDRAVFGGVAALALVSALLFLGLYPAMDSPDERVPARLRADLTALAVAAEEVSLLRELEGVEPSLDRLVAQGVAPFAVTSGTARTPVQWLAFEQCFMGQLQTTEATYLMRLEWPAAGGAPPYRVSWRQSRELITRARGCDTDGETWHYLGSDGAIGGSDHAH
ncbi:MAG: hypothetical protein AAGA11_20195 [Pseudomonadota bacterium]